MAATEREPLGRRKWLAEAGKFLACALGFLGLSFLFCYPAGLSSSTCILGGDTLAAYFPYLLRSFHPVSSNVAGPWDPTVLTGLPESHSPYGAYYPLMILLYWLFPAAQALSLGLVLHHALAGLGAYLLARTCRLSRPAAWLAGIVFGFGGFMVFHRGHLPIQYSAAWLPWVLWGLERFRTSGSLFWVAASGTLLALHALSAHVQMIVIGGFVWLTYLAYFTVTGPQETRIADLESRIDEERRLARSSILHPRSSFAQGRWRFLLGGLSACFLGAVGSLPQVLPMLEVARWSGHGEFNADFFNSGYLKFRFLVGLAGPWVLGGSFGASSPTGYWDLTEHGIFYGVLPLTAALLAILWFFFHRGRPVSSLTPRVSIGSSGDPHRPEASARRFADPGSDHKSLPTKKETGFWLVLFLESLVLMLGKTLPTHYLLSYLPIYHFFHMPSRHVWVMGLALAWLAGLGLDLLRNLPEPSRKRLLTRLGATLLVLAGICVLLIDSGLWPDRPGWTYPGFWLPGVSALASFGLLILVSQVKWFRSWAGALVAVLAFLELSLTIRDYELMQLPADVLTKPSAFPEVIGWLRDREPGSLPPRCLIRKETWMTKEGPLPVPAGFGSTWGLSSLSYYTQSMPRSLMRILQTDSYGSADFGALLAEERGLSAAGGRYILARGALPPFAPGLGDLEDLPAGLVWKTDDRSPGHPSPLAATDGGQKQPSTLVASLVTAPGETYLVEGVLPSHGPRQGTVRIVLTTRPSADILGETTFRPSDYQAGGIHFACLFDSGTLSGSFWITLECQDGQALSPPEINLWHLTAEYARSARLVDPREVARKLRAGIRQPYPLLARFADDLRVYENPHARPVAGFVREVRPAANDVDAAERITSPGPPVRELAYVVASGGRSQDWDLSGPAYFEPGTANLNCRRPDDLIGQTTNGGEGFLVLAVTRCVGWSATIDGEKAPIHGVDGPFMGVRVPAGEHTVRFRFRPVLVWAGTAAAGLILGGAWAGVLIGSVKRRRGRFQAADSLEPAHGLAA